MLTCVRRRGARGTAAALAISDVDTEAMQEHIDEISRHVAAWRDVCIPSPETPSGALGMPAYWAAGSDQVCLISVPSTFRHSRMKAASPVQPLAETMVPST